MQLLPHGPPARPFFFPQGSSRKAKGHSSLGCAHPSQSAVSGALGLALAPPHPSLGALEMGGAEVEENCLC